MTAIPSPATTWAPPARVRGVLAVVSGRGERATVYDRFGRRLSSDGYTVGVFEGDVDAAAAWLGTVTDAPRVLVGSDSGAADVLRALSQGDVADAAIIAGVPVALSTDDEPTDAERTACPVHLGVLADAAARTEHFIFEPVPPAAHLAAIAVPVLAFHGGADTVSPIVEVREALAAVPDLKLVETVDGLHDALNDQSHRSVAASIILWLEKLRAGDVHSPVVREYVENPA